MAKKDWGAIVKRASENNRSEAETKFIAARQALDVLPEQVMKPTGDGRITSKNNHVSESFQIETHSNHMDSDSVDLSVDQFNLVVRTDLLSSNPLNARYYYDDAIIESLSKSLLADGQKQPIIITNDPGKSGHFIIIDGEYRFRASKVANLDSIRCDYYVDVASEDLYYLSNLINEQRTSQTVFDNAKAWQKLIDEGHVANASGIAELTKKTAGVISKTLALNSIDDSIALIMSTAERPVGLAIAYEFSLLCKHVDTNRSKEIAIKIANGDLTIKDVERLKVALSSEKRAKKTSIPSRTLKMNGKRIGSLKLDNSKFSMDISMPNKEDHISLAQEIETLLSKYGVGG